MIAITAPTEARIGAPLFDFSQRSFELIDILKLTPAWPVGLLLFGSLLVLAYLAAVELIAEPGRRPSLAEAVAASTLGLICLGFLLLFIRWASLPSPILTVFLATAAVATGYRRRKVLLPRLEVRSGLTFATVVVVAAAFLLPCVIGGLMMAVGDYPEVFFHTDTASRLKHTYEFIEDRGMPPLSLSNLGIESQTHFAASAAAAAAALFTGLPPHSTFFLTLIAAAFGIVAATSLLAASACHRMPFALGFSLILGAAPLTVWYAGKATREWVSDPELFLNHFPDISTSFGFFLFLLLLYACLDFGKWRPTVLAALATVLMAATKTGYFPVAGLLLLSGSLVHSMGNSFMR